MTPEELSERLLNYAARVGKVVDALPNGKLGNHVANQLVRCGTSPQANYEEGCAAESRADFIHKLRVVLKELRDPATGCGTSSKPICFLGSGSPISSTRRRNSATSSASPSPRPAVTIETLLPSTSFVAFNLQFAIINLQFAILLAHDPPCVISRVLVSSVPPVGREEATISRSQYTKEWPGGSCAVLGRVTTRGEPTHARQR
jgi:hypothetical protein